MSDGYTLEGLFRRVSPTDAPPAFTEAESPPPHRMRPARPAKPTTARADSVKAGKRHVWKYKRRFLAERAGVTIQQLKNDEKRYGLDWANLDDVIDYQIWRRLNRAMGQRAWEYEKVTKETV